VRKAFDISLHRWKLAPSGRGCPLGLCCCNHVTAAGSCHVCDTRIRGNYYLCRYTGLKWERADVAKGIDTKGLQLVRRDSVPLVQDVCTSIINSILYERNTMKARTHARHIASELLHGRIPIEKLTLTKALRTGYKNLNLPHLAVARKMEERNPGSGPKPGDRVPYVLLATGDPKAKQSEKAEEPAYAVEKGLALDYAYYLVSFHTVFSLATTCWGGGHSMMLHNVGTPVETDLLRCERCRSTSSWCRF
jgi:hypothetical protein